ncbi:Ldh family oxidoreductase [Pseudovibrio brasiliensis]|uniref:Ldh family oxidoreductase n=1 Tax=Pseudovibrio brasiliensis TaxID=1898042 RepID=A0ABX8ANA8_9HYPH|nr:Ldh family oxidoreductase [Pseudovibrio brasiliensis]QUS56572.1 Ldh family oxidoreductase [Pseudovibrio brasiliensis]
MIEHVTLSLKEAYELSLSVLQNNGFNEDHARSIADVICACQLDDCHSHGLYRLLVCSDTIRAGHVNGEAGVTLTEPSQASVRADAQGGYSLVAFEKARPLLIQKAKQMGIAALAINNCYHFSALWPEVEKLSEAGLAAMAMVPSHAWVAPAGGSKGTMGTNPIAFSWPRAGKKPFTFDFATSVVARGEIELHRREGRPLSEGVAVDSAGNPTTDPEAALDGAMLTFGGYKGSALSIMIELLAGPLIDDLTSIESLEFDGGKGSTPYHGELILAFDPNLLSGGRTQTNDARAEKLFSQIVDQGARLPSQRRYEAREKNSKRNAVEIPKALHADILKLLEHEKTA